MKTHLVLWMMILFLIISCQKDNSNSYPKKLYGAWDWVQSSGGIMGETITPSTAGHSKTIEFSKNGFCTWYINGQLQDKKRFFLKEGASIYTSETAYFLEYEGDFIKQSIFFDENDIFYLRDECFDCYTHTYIRK